jgi:prepilin signal peptidase PulO-like enzyme (type II secretory pathway)
MLPYLIVLALIGGACVGSFCNVVIIRLHQQKTLGGRSRCMHCKQQLRIRHLVPIVSWIALGARCAFCKKSIHWQYPVVEVAGAVIAAAALITHTSIDGTISWTGAAYMAALFFTLLVITVFDIRWQLVPMEFTLGAALVLGAWNAFVHPVPVLVGALVTAFMLAAIVWMSGGRLMGEGDPAVGLLIGAALAWPTALVAIGAAFMIGGFVAMVLLALGVVKRKTPVPFVPFLSLGAVVAYFWGAQFIHAFSYAFF